MAITNEHLGSLTNSGGNVVNAAGDKIGGIGQFYVDDNTGEPSWVTAKTGLFGTSASFVPLQGADVVGDDIRVDYDKDLVKDAPRVDDDGNLSPEQEDQLYSYYGLGSGGVSTTRTSDTTTDDADYASAGTTSGNRDYTADRGTVGNDTSRANTDDSMTLSEERLNVGTQRQESGRARLRKYVVTENVTQTVPVQREEVRIEREPITDANIGDAKSGPAISEDEHEVVLHEERPVVEKEAVPVERVRLGTETVTEQATVSEEVRKEKIDTDVDGDRTGGTDRTDRTDR